MSSSSSSSPNDSNFLSFTFLEFDCKALIESFFFLADLVLRSDVDSLDLFSGFLKVILPSAIASSENKNKRRWSCCNVYMEKKYENRCVNAHDVALL